MRTRWGCIATSLYWNGTLPPTANSSTGIGSLSDAELEHLDFHPILWEEKDNLHGLIDGRKINPTVGRFLHFYFRQESDYEVANLNEVEIYGHKYVSHPQDMVCLNRSKWTSTGSSCKNCGEGWTGPAMYDWLLGPHEMEANAGDWVRIDFGETLSFSQIALVLTSGAKLDLFTTDDTTKWGNPLSSFTVPTSDTVTLNVPTQHARYLKIVNPGEPNGAWWHIFDVTLWSPLDPNSIGLKNQKKENRHSNYEPLMNRIFNLNGRKVTSKSVDFK